MGREDKQAPVRVSAKKAADRKLDELSALRGEPKSVAIEAKLRAALNDRAAYIAGKAAKIAGADGYSELIPDLTAAFHRYLGEDAAKADPQCLAKNAIARALRDLAYDEAELYLAGLRHRQLEAVWGGQQDTAAELRSICAHALVSCRGLRDLELLRVLVDALADSEKLVRVNAAQAMGQVPREETALLLRLKILAGDEEPEVIGECFRSILRNEPKQSVELIGRFLEPANPLVFEAIAALGESREPEAFEFLKRSHLEAVGREVRDAALRAIGASRQPAAIEFLLDRIRNRQSAREALEALAPLRGNEEVAARIEAAVRDSKSAMLEESFRKEFR